MLVCSTTSRWGETVQYYMCADVCRLGICVHKSAPGQWWTLDAAPLSSTLLSVHDHTVLAGITVA